MNFKLNRSWSDEVIVEGIKEGGRREHDAIINLFNKYNVALRRFISNRSSGEVFAKLPDDIIWETIEAFVLNVKKDKFQFGDASLETYLISICKNLWFRNISSENSRKERQYKYLNDDEVSEDVSQILIDNQNWEIYVNIVGQAGKNCRRILDMRLVDGLSMQEISKQLIEEGVFENDQTVRNTKSKCLKKIFELLKIN